VSNAVAQSVTPSLRRVINATGVVLHTNLGRAPLAPAAVDAIARVAQGFSNLEYDLEKGVRGSRYVHCSDLLRELTGAEDALVVNNGAAALVLVLNTVADGRDAIVSRGELVEIGGSFASPT
jgi:L-seryl-tRNA(Ser) seleniumtransferase